MDSQNFPSEDPQNNPEEIESADLTEKVEESIVSESESVLQEPKKNKKISYPVFVSVLCVVIAVTILLTYTVTAALKRDAYTEALLQKQEQIDALTQAQDDEFDQLSLVSAMLEQYSYYADQMSKEEMIEAALKAYVTATGDRYAAYYTEEEYAELHSASADYAGIGAATVQDKLTYQKTTYYGFSVSYFYQNSLAQAAGLQKGDFIYAVKVDGKFQSVEMLGGYEKALNCIRGQEGTTVELLVLRKAANNIYESIPLSIKRAIIQDPSVFYEVKLDDPTTALVSIRRFDLTTPKLFKNTVEHLKTRGVTHFVFDVRDNPGGDLLSIKAVLSFFLQEGDLILSAIDKDGKIAKSYYAEAITQSGEYASCNVKKEEIGMYADLDMVVLCNENTASAAEVFAANLRDYQMAKIVGTTTFGKGIMQMPIDMSQIETKEIEKGEFSGYLYLTTHAYVTKCGVTYHDVGIKPDEGLEVELPDALKELSIYELEQAVDTQLQMAFKQFTQK